MDALPADADDLGQVLQVLARVGARSDAITHSANAVRLIFEECLDDAGGFPTWLIPPGRDDARARQQRARIAPAGFGGPAPEVMSNLLVGLELLGVEAFAEARERTKRCIAGMQRAEGSWHSIWYVGPYYGTFACVRALGHRAPFDAVAERASRFILSAQRADGSWPGEARGGPCPLSTALAILVLDASVAPDRWTDAARACDAAFAFLASSRLEDGSWPAAPWLTVPYGSRSITTAYVVKAAQAVLRRGGAGSADQR